MADRSAAPFERYLRRIGAQLGALEPARREALLAELRAHLADAAATDGRDPADPAFQRLVIARLGPARRVGSELAAANGVDRSFTTRLLLWLGALGALLAPLVAVASFAAPNEEVAEFLLICALLPATLAVPALHRICRRAAPRLSLLTALVGGTAVALIPAVLLFNLLFPAWAGAAQTPVWFSIIWLSTPGLWAILSSVLIVRYLAALPRNASAKSSGPNAWLAAPAVLSVGWGCAWLVVATNTAEAARWAPLWAMNGALLAWLLCGLLWCATIAAALILTARAGLPAAPGARS